MKKIILLGSTGSIGTQTLDVVRQFPNHFQVVALSVYSNIELLKKQVEEFAVKYVAIVEEEKAKEFQRAFPSVAVFSGEDSLEELAAIQADILVNALVGAVGVEPTLAAIESGKDIALANKETLVVAGEKVMSLVQQKGVSLRPIDSEHSALQQCLRAGRKSEIKKLWLTCSGGPFVDAEKWPLERLKTVTVEQALAHPNWSMGKKISVDSATLANKGLELIEAMYLFQIPPEKIEVVIHPQSIVHSAIEFCDGSMIAEIGSADIRRYIAYALTGDERFTVENKPFSLFDKNLTFSQPDRERFECLVIAEKAAQMGQQACKNFNDANEIAVERFLKREIGFLEIIKNVKFV